MGAAHSAVDASEWQNAPEALAAYDSGASYVGVLTDTPGACRAIEDGGLVLGQVLGKGLSGTAVLAHVRGSRPPVEFVAKQLVMDEAGDEDTQVLTESSTLEAEAQNRARQFGIPAQLIVDRNGGDPGRALKRGDVVHVPRMAIDCRMWEPFSYQSNVDGATVDVPVGSLLCYNEVFSEFLISLLVARLLDSSGGVFCIGFPRTLGFATCPQARLRSDNFVPIYEYVFMEKLSGTLRGLLGSFLDQPGLHRMELPWLVQILGAICVYNNVYEISHNDLHADNVFFTEVRRDTEWNGHRLMDYDYLEYRLGETSLYVPRGDRVMKLGDWGLAAKFSAPMVMSQTVVADAYSGTVPNVYCPAYDVVVLLKWVHDLRDFQQTHETWTAVRALLRHCVGVSSLDDPRFTSLFSRSGFRPDLARLAEAPLKDVTAEALLLDERFFADYRTRPEQGQILLVCEL